MTPKLERSADHHRAWLDIGTNSAGYRKSQNNIMPESLILSWQYNMGGSWVSLGSDAYQVYHSGMHIEKIISLLVQMGVPDLAVFEHRQVKLLLSLKA